MCPAAAPRLSFRLNFAQGNHAAPELALRIMNNPAYALCGKFFASRLHLNSNVAAQRGRNYTAASCVKLLATSGARTRLRFCSTDCAALNTEATIRPAL